MQQASAAQKISDNVVGWLTALAGTGVGVLNTLQAVQAFVGIAVGVASLVLTIVLIRKHLKADAE